MADLYPYHPWRSESFERRVADVDQTEGRRAPRAAVAEALSERLGRWQAPPQSLAQAARLAQPGALAVVSGQQAGLLTGPLLTVWKALGVLWAARDLEARLGRPVVPIFWLATEDHDLDEVNQWQFVDATAELCKWRLELPSFGRTPVGNVTAGPAAEAFLRQLSSYPFTGAHREQILSWCQEVLTPEMSLGDGCARLLLKMLGGCGLVVLDPLDRALRRLLAPLLGQLLKDSAQLPAYFAQAEGRLAKHGQGPQVRREPGALGLFTIESGQRLQLYQHAGGLAPQGQTPQDVGHWLRLAEKEPWRLSTGALLRPLAQEYLLPVVTYLAGPSEILYQAQDRDLFEAFGFKLPILTPRPHVTLVEGTVARVLERYEVAPDEARHWQHILEQRLRQADEIGIEAMFAALEADLHRHYAVMGGALPALDPALQAIVAQNEGRVRHEIAWLRQKAEQAHRAHHEVLVRQFKKLGQNLFPLGQPQDRVLNVIPFLFRHGPALLETLAEASYWQGPEDTYLFLSS